MRVGITSSCAIGLAIALTLGAVPSAQAQQTDTTRRKPTSSQRVRISKGEVAPPVNQDSINAAERARQDSIAAAERARQEELARLEQMRRDSIAAAERRRQDSLAAVERARMDSIARADSIARERARIRAMMWGGGFWVGAGGGVTIPAGRISNSAPFTGGYTTGWGFTVPIGYDWPGQWFGLRVDYAFDRMGGDNYTVVTNGIANNIDAKALTNNAFNFDGKLRVPLGRTWSRFYVIGGATVSNLSGWSNTPETGGNQVEVGDAGWDWGWNAGAGFTFAWGRTGLFLESRYVLVNRSGQVIGFPYSNASWVPITLGIQF